MDGISGFRTTDYSNLFIDQAGPDDYTLTVPDSETGEVEQHTGLTEEQINQILAQQGLTIVGGELRPVDDFSVEGHADRLAVVTSFGGDPPLPDVGGPTSTPQEFGRCLDGAASAPGFGDGTADLMWMALSTLAEGAMKDMKTAKELRHAMQREAREMGKLEIAAAEKRIEEERKAAITGLVTSVAAAAVTFTMGGIGGAGTGWANSAAQASATAMGTMTSELGKTINKVWGAQASADKLQIQEKEFQQMAKENENLAGDARGMYEDSKELFKLSLRVMQEYQERQTQALNNLLR